MIFYIFWTLLEVDGSLNVKSRGTKRKLDNNNSEALWNKRLCHIFKNIVEILMSNGILWKKIIKSVKSDRGGEYYGRYDDSGEQRPRPFTKYLEECGIVP